MRSSRSAPTMTSIAMPSTSAASDGESVSAMITAANNTYEASSRRTAATPTRHGPGR
ncbi:hypothetical protein RKD25_002373 [Streptomyces sp. SAI-124]